jgi:cytokinin dehydrogenase
MAQPINRRTMIRGLTAGALIVGFDPVARAWASAPGRNGLTGLPPLDGVLLTDPADLAAAADDYGHIVHRTPLAVLQPGSVSDVTEMLGFCQRVGLPVAPRGQGHQTYGQAQVAGGLVIEMSPLDSIQVLADRAVVQAGATWGALLTATLAHGLTPLVFTDYIGLSIGGTLSVGGIGGASQHHGAQVDAVLELEVATGTGRLVSCSPTSNPELFNAALSGLGQCGVIVSATIPLVTAPATVRQYNLTYPTVAALTADQRKVVLDGRFDWLEGTTATTSTGAWQYVLEGAAYYTGNPPDDSSLIGDLDYLPGTAQISDIDYGDFINILASTVTFLESTGEWYDPHPWLNLFLPDEITDAYVTELMSGLSPASLGASGLVLLYPVPTARFTRPLLRVPHSGDVTFLLSVLYTSAPDTGGLPASTEVASNRELFLRARALGGYQYPVGSVPMTQADWQRQYGPQWPFLAAAKAAFDPGRVLTPGQGIFPGKGA